MDRTSPSFASASTPPWPTTPRRWPPRGAEARQRHQGGGALQEPEVLRVLNLGRGPRAKCRLEALQPADGASSGTEGPPGRRGRGRDGAGPNEIKREGASRRIDV